MMYAVVYEHLVCDNIPDNSTVKVYYCEKRDLAIEYMKRRCNRLTTRAKSHDCTNITIKISDESSCLTYMDNNKSIIIDSFLVVEAKEISKGLNGPILV